MKKIRSMLALISACLLVFVSLADAAQLSRLHADTIANGSIANASDLNDEYNNLYNESNSQDTRLTTIESGTASFSGAKTFLGTASFSGASTFSAASTFNSTVNFTSHINFARTGDQGTPVEGDFWENNTSHLFKFYDGTNTQTVATVSNIPPVLQSYLSGLTISNDGTTPNTDIDTTAGIAADSTAVDYMKMSAMVKRVSTAWVVGSGNGCLDTGTMPTSGTVHIFVIKRTDTGVVDELCSVSATSPTLPTNYTEYRRIGSVVTDASVHNIAFVQHGDRFDFKTPPALDVDVTNQGTTSITRTLSVPKGIQVEAILNTMVDNSSPAQSAVYFRNLELADIAPSLSVSPLAQIITDNNSGTSDFGTGQIRILTNTSGQIGTRGTTTNIILKIATIGWVDSRGRTD